MAEIFEVSQINEYLRQRFEADEFLGSLLIRGELSNYKIYPSGHHYFTLKDSQSAIRCVMFKGSAMRLRFRPETGMGVLAEISPVPYQDLTEVLDGVEAAGRVPFVLILDRVTDVRNFGAIVRSAECAGVDVVIIPNKNSAKISSDALKTSAGALYHVPVCRVLNLKRVVRELKFQRGIRVYAATEKAEKFYTGADLTLPTAIIMGSEDKGIDEELINIATDCIKIPQKGQIESLNVSAAAAVLLFEVVRQRG